MKSVIGFLLMLLGAGLLILDSSSGILGVENFLSAILLIWGVVFAFELDRIFWGNRKFDPNDQSHYAIKPNESRRPPMNAEEARDPWKLG